jgi:hypothetical protein
MRKIAGAGVALLLVLGACEDGTPEQNRTEVKPRNDYVEQLRALSELNRGLGLRRAILDMPDGKCKRVDYSGFQQDYRNLSMWIVRCSDGNDWALFIAPNADVQVRNCHDMKSLGLPECRFPATAATKPGQPR